jgi:hypothetical protein
MLTSRHSLLLVTIEELAQQRDRLLRDLELKRDAGSLNLQINGGQTLSGERINDLLQHVSNLSRTQQALQLSVAGLKTDMSAILSSRIWRTMVAAGGVVLRFLPGRRD